MAAKRSVLILSFSDLGIDNRVQRQIAYFRNRQDRVHTLALGPCKMADVGFTSLRVPDRSWPQRLRRAGLLSMGAYERFYWTHPRIQKALCEVNPGRFDMVLANDVDTLPLALKLAGRAPVIVDLHEYAPKEFEEGFLWRHLVGPYKHYLCEQYLGKTHLALTVSPGLALAYKEQFGRECVLFTNAPYFQDLSPRPVTGDRIRMIYHGMALPSRRVEDAFSIFEHLDKRFHLDVILVPGDRKYVQRLKGRWGHSPRVRFLDPVQPTEIPRFCNAYDIGFFPLRGSNYNYQHCLPNKLFEFIQARLASVTSDLPDMAELLRQSGCGKVASLPPKAFAGALNALASDEISRMKQAAHRVAPELCAERNYEGFEHRLQQLGV